jgi:hypothetical protein
MFDPKVTGISTSHESVITVPGVRTISATAVKTQLTPSAKTFKSTSAASRVPAPPSIRKPMTSPTASTNAAETV